MYNYQMIPVLCNDVPITPMTDFPTYTTIPWHKFIEFSIIVYTNLHHGQKKCISVKWNSVDAMELELPNWISLKYHSSDDLRLQEEVHSSGLRIPCYLLSWNICKMFPNTMKTHQKSIILCIFFFFKKLIEENMPFICNKQGYWNEVACT